MPKPKKKFMRQAIELALRGVEEGAAPFGAVIVKDGEVVASAHNTVKRTNNPTQHAEMRAIQQACEVLERHKLTGCALYTTCVPCTMCIGAIYWADLDAVFYGTGAEEARSNGFMYLQSYYDRDKKKRNAELGMRQFMADECDSMMEAAVKKVETKLSLQIV